MKTLLLAAALAGAAPMCCAAASPSNKLDEAFAGTVISTYSDGRKAKLWLNRDGSYTAEGRRHDRSSGHWKIKGEQICLRQSHPPTLPFSYCTAIPSGRNGASWPAKSVFGDPITVRLVPGRSGAS